MFSKIIQVVSELNFGDAVGNNVMDISIMLTENGIQNMIVSDRISEGYNIENINFKYSNELKNIVSTETLVIFHFSGRSFLIYDVAGLNCPKVLLSHNSTPSVFFAGYNNAAEEASKAAMIDLQAVSKHFQRSWGVSEYNCLQLQKAGYKNITTVPLFIDFSRFSECNSSGRIIKKPGSKSILFIGRIVPNKRHEDIIKAFYYYKRYNPNSTLTFIGTASGFEGYKEELIMLAKKLDIDVNFTQKIPLQDMVAYYEQADLFLSMSEHEGFCVPLLEAMYFEVPVIAYASSAIPETVGEAGILFHKKNFVSVAALMNIVLENTEIIQKMKKAGKDRVNHFSKKNTTKIMLSAIYKYAEDFGI